ncbi:MAG: DUF5317 family protein [Actinomycetota bacterium]
MLLLLATMIGLGLIGGFLARGTIDGLKQLDLRLSLVLFLSLLVALLPLFSDSLNEHRRVFQLASFAGILLFLVVNIWTSRGEVRAGMVVIAIGWALNFIVIAANGGMPLSRWAYEHSGQTAPITYGSGGFYRIVRAHPGTHLRFLGDVIPVRGYNEVVSIGDIFLIVGIALVIAAAMRTVRRTPAAAEPVGH